MLQPDPLLWQAIERRRMIRLVYDGKERLLEPHDHGVLNHSPTVGIPGCRRQQPSPSGIPMKVNEVEDLEVLEKTFAGGRPQASGKHLRWEVLFIRVQPAR